jgi:integrase
VIENMPRPRPPHLHRETTRHKKPVWYVRVSKGPRIRIRAEYGTPEFDAEYQAAINGDGAANARRNAAAGSLQWLIERFRETPAWLSLSPATRSKREAIFRQIIETAGQKPFTAIREAEIAAGRDRRGRTPFQARHFLDTMRGLYAWAKEAAFVKFDPAAGVKYPTLKSGEGFPVWTDSDVAVYERRWSIGTRERVWFDLLSYTGLRRGDAVRLGKQHVRDGEAMITTEKSGGKVEVIIPLHLFPALLDTLRAGPTGDLAFVCGANGKPMTKESFGNAFRDSCRAAGIKKSAHGLRKLAATRAADAGASIWQLNAMFGWTGTKMASHYTQAFERKRAAREGFKKLVTNDSTTSIPAPDQKVRAPGRK